MDTSRGSRIVFEASRFLGLTEIAPNRKWDLLATPGHDPIADELVRVLTLAGWEPSWPYCAAFVEAVWRLAHADVPTIAAQIAAVLNPSCLSSWHNAETKGWTSKAPTVGAIGILQLGNSDHGHAVLVERVEGMWIRTIEGNTSANPGTAEADRNGDGVFRKSRPLVFAKTSGLHLVGFIRPPAM